MPSRIRRFLFPAAVALVVAVALLLRLNNYRFGLPSLWDPDEPIFMMKAVEMLSSGDLNPRWFGHPGSTTIYLVALVDLVTVAWGVASGAHPSVEQFIRAAYDDPGLLFGPARLAMVVVGTLVVLLTYVVGRRLFGRTVGLIAAALLALNALHIAWSQVIRTDILASLFMLGALHFAVGAARGGRRRDYALAGLCTGFAIATKWPAAVIFIAVVGALAYRARRTGRVDGQSLAMAGLGALTGLFAASPYLLLDWQTVFANVGGEVKSGHLAQNGGGLLDNLWWFVSRPIAGSMSWLGVALVGLGGWLAITRHPVARLTLVPAALVFLILISSQHIIYSRWLLPALPFLCLLAALAVRAIGRAIAKRFPAIGARPATALVALAALIPSAANAVAGSIERANDTRGQAARWAARSIPSGSTILIEHLEFSLRAQPWTFLFPMGGAGCVDGEKLLSQDIRYDDVQSARRGSPIIDVGNVDSKRIETCRADYAILTYYDLYRAEGDRYPAELETYRKVLSGGRTVALFVPRPGRSSGPVVRIVALPRRDS